MNNYPPSNARPTLVLPKIPVRGFLTGIVIFFIFIILFSSFYTVGTQEEGVVLRLGRYNRTVEPGLHFKIPLGVDRVQLVPVERQEKQEFGFRTVVADVQSTFIDHHQDANLLKESLMVTGDLNTALVEWIVQYRIKEPKDYLFNVKNPEETLRYASEAMMREVVGDRTVDEVLTVGRTEISALVGQKLQGVMDEYKMGIQIERVVMQDVTPPDPVKSSFNAVNQAQQERERLINEARSEYNKIIPRARGQALQKIQEAEGYAMRRVNESQGDATRFNALFIEYMKAPEVTRRRIYLETMGDILPRLGRKFIIDENSRGVLPLMQLATEPEEAPKP